MAKINDDRGDKFEFTTGSKAGVMIGSSFDAMVGAKSEVAVAMSTALKAGITFVAEFGHHYSYFKGGKKEYAESDSEIVSDKNQIVAAGDNLCLAGGTNTDGLPAAPNDRNSIINLKENFLDISVGQKQILIANANAGQRLLVGAIAAVVLTSIGTATATALAGGVNQDSDDAEGNWAPWPYQVGLGVASGLQLIASIVLTYALCQEAKKKASPVKHQGNEVYASISLESQQGNIVVGAKNAIWVDANQISIRMFNPQHAPTSEISISNTGQITIHSGASVVLSSAVDVTVHAGRKLTLQGTRVDIKGLIEQNGTALNIQPAGAVPAPTGLTERTPPRFQRRRP
jgi:hypothetical protein